MKKPSPQKNISIVKSHKPPESPDFAAVRQQIKDRVGQEAMNMVESAIGAANNGQYAALKYLFEAVGLFPLDVQSDSSQQDVLAPALLQALGLPDNTVTKDSAGS